MAGIENKLLEQLRAFARQRRVTLPGGEPPLGFGARAADWVAANMGSWRFILIQSAILIAWIVSNALNGNGFDPYPFILLNLVLSFQAAYAAPIIMMSQNRQSDMDRVRAIADFAINTKAELEIEALHAKLDLMREKEIATLTASVERLTRLLEERRGA
jgi:uncharacterized membrane protein